MFPLRPRADGPDPDDGDDPAPSVSFPLVVGAAFLLAVVLSIALDALVNGLR